MSFASSLLHGAAFAIEKQLGFAHEFSIAGLVDATGARRAAALDLEQQAGPRAGIENGIRTRAQQKRALQRVECAVHGAGAGERPEIDSFGRLGAAMFQKLRKGVVLAQQDVGKGFVVAIGDIVAGLQPLDEIGFQQQRLGLRRCGDEQHLRGLRDHARDALGMPACFGVGRHPLLQALGLADIKHIALRIEHAIDAGLIGQGLQIGGDARGPFERGRDVGRFVHRSDIGAGQSICQDREFAVVRKMSTSGVYTLRLIMEFEWDLAK